MTTPAFPNSFTSATTIFATSINSNYTTWLSMLVDGTYTHTIGNLTASTATISGDVNIGSSTSQFAYFNGAFNTHLLGSGVNLGSVTYPFGAAYLDYGTSHAGAVYFNAGTTQYMQVTSAGTSFDFNGFSYVDFNSGVVTNVGTITASNLTIGTDMTVSGFIYGGRTSYDFYGSISTTDAVTQFVGIGINTNISMGNIAIRSGSVANIAYNIVNQTVTGGPGRVSLRLYKNGSSIYTIASFAVASAGVANTGVVSFAKGSYTVAASDIIGVAFDSYTTGTEAYQCYVSVDLYEDS